MDTLSKVYSELDESYAVERMNRRGNTLHVYMRDINRTYEVSVKDGKIHVIEVDDMGGGKIGGVEFEDASKAASHITSY